MSSGNASRWTSSQRLESRLLASLHSSAWSLDISKAQKLPRTGAIKDLAPTEHAFGGRLGRNFRNPDHLGAVLQLLVEPLHRGLPANQSTGLFSDLDPT